MQNPVDNFWKVRLNILKEELESNNFEVFTVQSAADAKELVLHNLMPQIAPKTVSWGGSMTFGSVGLAAELMNDTALTVINPYEPNIAPSESYERRRQALLVDLYFTGTNAITEEGHLVNLDMIGNRVGALNFGPRNVIVLVGRNKLVPSLEDAMLRIKNFVAPANVMRLDKKTPCLTTSVCQYCKSSDRICNVWTITEKAFPKHRIKVVLINEDLGF
ncbi:MAG TPA: lactate utilization protein [Dissulfurispiraceae bacterium]|nr:lactate utilization protein [Dissulfurispiraceae bacterium]